MKHIECGSLMPGCDYRADAETEGALLRKVAQHVRTAHPEVEVNDRLVEKVRAKIEEKDAA